jgi:hypothetical protein
MEDYYHNREKNTLNLVSCDLAMNNNDKSARNYAKESKSKLSEMIRKCNLESAADENIFQEIDTRVWNLDFPPTQTNEEGLLKFHKSLTPNGTYCVKASFTAKRNAKRSNCYLDIFKTSEIADIVLVVRIAQQRNVRR